MAPIAGEAKCSAACGSAGAAMTAWNSSHSETKPLSGGKAEAASAPTRKKAAVRGMRWMRPPSPSRSRRPVACSTAPAPRKSSDLNQE